MRTIPEIIHEIRDRAARVAQIHPDLSPNHRGNLHGITLTNAEACSLADAAERGLGTGNRGPVKS